MPFYVKAHVAMRGTLDIVHVLEYNISIPRFACFQYVTEDEAESIVDTAPEARTRGQVFSHLHYFRLNLALFSA